MGSHQNFRRINRLLIEEAIAGDSLWSIEFRFRQWIGAMRSHENYEEQKLYPFLARRFGVSNDVGEIAIAVEGHQALHRAYDEVILAFASLAEHDGDRTPRERNGLVDALREHDAVLNAHLDQEEDMVIPALLALTREEFREYYNETLPQLLRRLSARGF